MRRFENGIGFNKLDSRLTQLFRTFDIPGLEVAQIVEGDTIERRLKGLGLRLELLAVELGEEILLLPETLERFVRVDVADEVEAGSDRTEGRLVDGDQFELTLSFEDHDPVIIDVDVIKPGEDVFNDHPHH